MKGKKLIVLILAAILAVGSVATITACDLPGISSGAEYYGCPNSKRVKRLNLVKTLLRK